VKTSGEPAGDARLAQRLVALFALGWLLLAPPLVSLALGPGRLFGLPRAAVILIGGWAAFIALLAWWMERRR
jgi:hypothetical protein